MDANKLYEQYKNLIWSFAIKYKVDIDVCYIGFMEAVNTYDENKGAKFNTYLTLRLKDYCCKEKRLHSAKKRQGENDVISYNMDWLGGKPRDSIIPYIKQHLSIIDWELIYNYYFKGYSQTELAKRYNITQVSLSRWLQKIYAKIKEVA